MHFQKELDVEEPAGREILLNTADEVSLLLKDEAHCAAQFSTPRGASEKRMTERRVRMTANRAQFETQLGRGAPKS